MLRDFKFLRRNGGKNTNAEEDENVPLDPRDSLNPQMSADPSRAPFSAIQESSRIPKAISDKELSSFKANRVDRTPTKTKHKNSDTSMPLRTPEKIGAMSRNRFNWAQKSECPSANSYMETKEEGRVASNANTPGSTRGMSKANLNYSETNSTQTTPTKSVSKPPNPGFSSVSGSRAVLNIGARMANYAALSKGIPSSCNSSTVVNSVEVPYFELKEDPSFWMEHNVQVSYFSFNLSICHEFCFKLPWKVCHCNFLSAQAIVI